ncbi:Protein of unknown function [Desulfonispora thiosulfatigenes DSM 11270]|uniref:DUF3866 domain-containing protein n=1 Tax=Desulfonispora thiosulfatigenes DSM 11270 TaxID=656914 RepID=A0A1W1VPH2_DESTI|nr:DUF3866 family protein [Desulfonispora thiosulfatigenes]SMB95259.1 Protein of unknown function [Desulfonispora thiosulfatigenes DSM 11270]
MIRIRLGLVVEILKESPELQIVLININNAKYKAISFPKMIGKLVNNEEVLVNTTAFTLNLGTGGYHFIMGKLSNPNCDTVTKGHIMKLRYTPEQIKVLSVEEEDSPYHNEIKNFQSLNKAPVLIGFLHSMLIPTIAGIKALNPNLKISYIMTDGGALPMAFSHTVAFLNKLKWLNGTVTTGNSYGGQLEAINIYSGLAAAYEVLKADIIIVIMGPGVVGTGTSLGTTALEVGQIINAVHSLEGNPILIPRINFNESRKRHIGVSHHVLTVLNKIALAKTTVVIPKIDNKDKANYVNDQLKCHEIFDKHSIIYEDGKLGLKYLEKHNINVKTMGQDLSQARTFFETCCAAGTYTAKLK